MGRRRSCVWMVLLVLVATSALSGAAFAQEQTLIAASFVGVGFGARAIGMGGAFVAVADDATAVYWNPAGLAQIPTPQLSLVAATATSLEMYGAMDWQAVPGGYLGTAQMYDASLGTEGFEVQFLSVVMPRHEPGRRSAWALCYSQDGKFEETGVFDDPGIPDVLPAGVDLWQLGTEFQSLTAAYAIGDENNMFGVSLISQKAEFSARWVLNAGGAEPVVQEYEADDSGVGWQLGWLGRRDNVTWGATYRSDGGQDVTVVDVYPANWAIGASLQATEDLRLAAAYRRFNDVEGNILQWYAVDSYHLGGEYLYHTGDRTYPIRFGVYRRAPDEELLDETDVFTLGTGIAGPRTSFDVAFEFGSDDFRRYTVSLVSAIQ